MNYDEQAQEIVGKWGYEEPYWWEPISKTLTEAFESDRDLGMKADEVLREEGRAEENEAWLNDRRCKGITKV